MVSLSLRGSYHSCNSSHGKLSHNTGKTQPRKRGFFSAIQASAQVTFSDYLVEIGLKGRKDVKIYLTVMQFF